MLSAAPERLGVWCLGDVGWSDLGDPVARRLDAFRDGRYKRVDEAVAGKRLGDGSGTLMNCLRDARWRPEGGEVAQFFRGGGPLPWHFFRDRICAAIKNARRSEGLKMQEKEEVLTVSCRLCS